MDGGAYTAIAHRVLEGGGEQLEESASATTEEADVILARRRCCCFWVPRFGSGRSAPVAGQGEGAWERIGGGAAAEAPWWRQALMKVREWSEIVAGPRWKTFIRRFNRNYRWGGGGGGGTGGGLCGISGGSGGGGAKAGKFQYDPLSYALNFDEGHGQDGDDDDDDYGYRNFSARYVLPPSLAKPSMDLGGRDAPPLFSAT